MAVVNLLKSDFLTQGPIGIEFEDRIANYCDGKFGLACSNATAGLQLAYSALGVGPGSIVWTSPITFAATANAAINCGASVKFIDISATDRNLCINRLAEKLRQASVRGELPDLVVPVHFSGLPCDMQAIYEMSKEFKFKIVEDASHALGASYSTENQEKNKVGNCKFSDATVFSFHPVKMITTGEGGMVLTNNGLVNEKMTELRSHGITRKKQKIKNKQFVNSSWYYEQQALGHNYRLSDLNSALGLSQSYKLDEFVAKRRILANLYLEKLDQKKFKLPMFTSLSKSSWHLFVVEILNSNFSKRENFINYLNEKGIGSNVHYIPVYRMPYHSSGTDRQECPNAEKYFEACVSIPLHHKMNLVDAEYVIETCNNYSFI